MNFLWVMLLICSAMTPPCTAAWRLALKAVVSSLLPQPPAAGAKLRTCRVQLTCLVSIADQRGADDRAESQRTQQEEGRALQPWIPGVSPRPRLPLNPAKPPAKWDKTFSLRHNTKFTMAAGAGKKLPLDLTEASIVTLKLYVNTARPDRFSVSLDDGGPTPIWSAKARVLTPTAGVVTASVTIPAERVAGTKRWNVRLRNPSPRAAFVEVIVAVSVRESE